MPLIAGSIQLYGTDVTATPAWKRVRMGLSRTFQHNNLFLSLSVYDNVQLQDRERMKQGHYAGFVALPFEDFAVTSSQGKITDRTKEHLGASDIAIIRMRRTLLDLARNYQDGKLPRMFEEEIDYGKINALHEIITPAGERIEVA